MSTAVVRTRMPSSVCSPKASAWRASASITRALGSRCMRISTSVSAESSRFASFLMRRSAISALRATICSSVLASITRQRVASTTVAVAVRGLPLRIAISPRNSPGPSTASTLSSPPIALEMRTAPAWMTNITSPASPSRKSTSPG